MKYFAFILSLYFILLASLPCQDNEDMTSSQVSTAIQKNQDKGHQKHQENCPPFCSCYCCSTARQVIAQVSVSVFSKTVLCLYPEYAISPLQDQPIKIWQPPQAA